MNIVFNASAGTGKTYQVAGLYEKLVLEEGIDPRKILLTTFTDNAANELRMRVARRLNKARRNAEIQGDSDLAERAMSALSHLPSAQIGTIHSFCTRLLREHALEAGLSPGFSVLEKDERTGLLDRICREELLARLESDPDFKTFCTGSYIIGTGNGFAISITETVPDLLAQAASLGIPLENAETMLTEPSSPVSIHEFRSIHTRLQNLPKLSKKVEGAMVLLGECLDQTTSALELIDLFSRQFSGHFSYGDAKTIYPHFKELKDEAVERELYRKRFPAAKAFARYLQAVVHQFRQRKHAMDVVDFDDQLRMAAELLQSGKAKPVFSHVIVDEVQDTSRLQCEIVKSLWGPETDLIICGDRKQSIYAWRGADPQVMPDLQQLILDSGGRLENLQTSYRSKSPILDVVNTLFTSVYGEEEYSGTENLKSNYDFDTTDEKPCVEFLVPGRELSEAPKFEKVAAEMQAVANRIQLLVNGSNDWKPNYRFDGGFAPVSDTNRYRYSDILVLLRRTTHQPALEQALRHTGIPYTLGGKGRGLFTRQETRDVSLFLNVVTNPQDACSLVGFLRSPWVGLSDETISELAWSESGFSIENLLSNHSQTTDIVDRYRKLTGTKLASELVRMLIDETGYDALLAGLPRGTQLLANLRKVLDWLRETERGAQTTPAAVARKLAEQIARPPEVPEAALPDPAQNAVTIMTVHGAKGLTKRVVFVPDTSFRPDSDKGFAQVFHDEHRVPRLGVKVAAPDRSSAVSPGFKAANNRARALRDHELKNLFYVAMTRARDLVVTSASVGRNPEGWFKHLESLIGNVIPSIPYSTLCTAVDMAEHTQPEPSTAESLAAVLKTLPQPPEYPSLRRIPATRLAKEQDEIETVTGELDDIAFHSTERATAIGSLGHAVLEQLALNRWEGSVEKWLEILRSEFAVGGAQATALRQRIEQTRELMRDLTGDMYEIRPEFPFVLLEGNQLIDGTIDLLCHTNDGFSIFDYKFTESNDTTVVDNYRGQMEIYRKAGSRAFPDATRCEIRLVVVSTRGPRLVPIETV